MGILDQEAVAGFLRMCDDGWLQGWHERNGGNLTCRLLPGEVERCRPWLHAPLRRAELGVEAPELAGEYFLTTGSGKYFRNVRRAPLENIGIVRIDGSGSAYEIVWGLEGDARPTSEFASHILNHRVRREVTRGRDRVIYHAHTPALIAMTYILPLTDRDFTRILWKAPWCSLQGWALWTGWCRAGRKLRGRQAGRWRGMTLLYGRTTACSARGRIMILRSA